MTHEEIDRIWQQAMRQSIEAGEMFTRYHFAKLVAEHEREHLVQIGLIGVLKHCEDLLREDGHEDAVDDVQNMIAKIKTRGQA
jgi:predicted SAM-dependent methyltransferase